MSVTVYTEEEVINLLTRGIMRGQMKEVDNQGNRIERKNWHEEITIHEKVMLDNIARYIISHYDKRHHKFNP